MEQVDEGGCTSRLIPEQNNADASMYSLFHPSLRSDDSLYHCLIDTINQMHQSQLYLSLGLSNHIPFV
jgi:hypothetical protein